MHHGSFNRLDKHRAKQLDLKTKLDSKERLLRIDLDTINQLRGELGYKPLKIKELEK